MCSRWLSTRLRCPRASLIRRRRSSSSRYSTPAHASQCRNRPQGGSMLRKYNINGAMYEYDLDRPSVRDAMMLKTATGMNMVPFTQAFNDVDPACFTALAWLLLTRAGVKGPSGAPIQLDDVPDFDLLEFLNPEQDVEESDGEVDPTIGSFSPSGIAPDSMSPELSTVTA